MLSLDSIAEVHKIKVHPHRLICFANGDATCCSSRDAIFFCRSSLGAYATLRGLFCTGDTDLSMIMSFSLANILIPIIRPCIPPALPPRLHVACRSPK